MKFFNHLINSKSKYDITTYMLKKIKAVTMIENASRCPDIEDAYLLLLVK